MRRYQSRLESLQRLRDQQEQLAGAHAAVCQQRHSLAVNAVAELERQLVSTNQDIGKLQQSNLGAELFHGLMHLYRHQQTELLAARQTTVIASQEADEALEAWTGARRDLKSIERQMETERQEHRRSELIREEHRQQETAAQAFFARSNANNGESAR